MKPWAIAIASAAGIAAILLFATRSKAASTARVGLIGDSLIAGLDGLVSGQVACVGFVGQGAGFIAGRLGDVLRFGPTHVVVLAGVNDIAAGRGADFVKHNLGNIYDSIRDAGAKPIAVQLTPWRGHAAGKNHQAETLSVNAWIQSQGVTWVNTASLGDANGTLRKEYDSGDGLHLNQEGRVRLAELIRKKVR